MKNLKLNQMEQVAGGEMSEAETRCRLGIGTSAIVGGLMFGLPGMIVGSIWGAYFNC
jgi:hypothetical protein